MAAKICRAIERTISGTVFFDAGEREIPTPAIIRKDDAGVYYYWRMTDAECDADRLASSAASATLAR